MGPNQTSIWLNLLFATGPFLNPIKTENLWFSDVFKAYRKRPVVWNIVKSENRKYCENTSNSAKLLNFCRYSRMDQVKFLKGFFNKFYLVHSWIFCPTCSSQLQPSLYLLLTSTLRLAALLLADIFQLRDEHWCFLSCFCGKVIFDSVYNCFYNLMITEGCG